MRSPTLTPRAGAALRQVAAPAERRRAARCAAAARGGLAAVAAALLAAAAALPAVTVAAAPTTQVLSYHADPARSGLFVAPSFTWQSVRHLAADRAFHASIRGHVYAQPLYWRGSGAYALLLIATEENTLYALDGATGRTLWSVALGRPVPLSTQPCGDIDPLGITGTPVIDPATGTLYVDAMRRGRGDAAEHALFAISVADGAVRPGWPIDIAGALARTGTPFIARNQNQRGALALLEGRVYVPYSGHFGDCGNYHGWVVGIGVAAPHTVISWHTAARGGGIWGPAGISSDGRSLFVATGNTFGTRSWAGGEAVLKLSATLAFAASPADYFAPSDWYTLDRRDADLGSVAPMPVRLGAAERVVTLGKDRRAYLLDANHLGGIGGALAVQQVADAAIRTAPAAYRVGENVDLAFQGPGSHCPAGQGSGLTVLQLSAGAMPMRTLWCAEVRGSGSPIVTTTDGTSEPIVWALGVEGDERLHAFRGDNGQALFVSDPLPGLERFQSLIVADGRVYVAADDHVYAFSLATP